MELSNMEPCMELTSWRTYDFAEETERAWARMEQHRRLICNIIDRDPAADERRKAEFFRLRRNSHARNQVGAYDLPTPSNHNVVALYEDALAAALDATEVALNGGRPRAAFGTGETYHGSKKKTIQRPPPPPKWSLHLPRGSNETNTLTVCSSWGCLSPAERRCQQKIPGFPKTGGSSKVRCWGASCAKHFTFEVSGRTALRICEACAHKEEELPFIQDP
jgi:hypothetical protein